MFEMFNIIGLVANMEIAVGWKDWFQMLLVKINSLRNHVGKMD